MKATHRTLGHQAGFRGFALTCPGGPDEEEACGRGHATAWKRDDGSSWTPVLPNLHHEGRG